MTTSTAVPKLFQPLKIRGLTLKNRIVVSPMCQYSSTDGFANNWHLVHIGSRAAGGVGLIIMEATAVAPEGRISPQDLGLWKDDHIPMLKTIVDFAHSQGCHIGIQIAHAGRKASTYRPWETGTSNKAAVPVDQGGWIPVAPSPIAYSGRYSVPTELTVDQIRNITQQFVDTAKRAVTAGFDLIELHAAHGYLQHSFYSPKSNLRTDEYGGSFNSRVRFTLETTKAVRSAIPEDMPLFVRLSASDHVPDGWNIEDTIRLSTLLKEIGTDLIDVSSGGNCHEQKIAVGPGYQVEFSEAVREQVHIPTGTVGLITDPKQANDILEEGKADVVLMAREFLRDPYFPVKAARELNYKGLKVPPQYERAFQ